MSNRIKLYSLFFFSMFLTLTQAFGQKQTVKGIVVNLNNVPLAGVAVHPEGSREGTFTNEKGLYSLSAEKGSTILFTYHDTTISVVVGDTPIINIRMKSVTNIGEIVILGTRTGSRSRMESLVPVDVFNMPELTKSMGRVSLSDMLNTVVPSLSSVTHSAMNLSDFVDAPTLRGMSPDQTLVLVNEKRLHPSALINVTGGTSNGSIGTDLNIIPSFALEKVEVLRDGASAQYGSDAIAGVMDLQLKKSTDGLTGQVSYGGHLTNEADNFHGDWDGSEVQVDLNYGTKIGKRGGFLNLTGAFDFHDRTSRSMDREGEIYNLYNAIHERAKENGVELEKMFGNINSLQGTNLANLITTIKQYAGDVGYLDQNTLNQIQNATTLSDLQNLLSADVTNQELAYRGLERKDFSMEAGRPEGSSSQFFFNTEIPLNAQWKLYGFGGFTYRTSDAAGFYRLPLVGPFSPYQVGPSIPSLFPNGYLSRTKARVYDYTSTVGLKRTFGKWDFDLSNTLGENIINVEDVNAPNATLRYNSPLDFSAGGFSFLQNTINLDVKRSFDVLKGLDLALGVEHRLENYHLRAGDPGAYDTYDIYGNVITTATPDSDRPTDFFGDLLPGGAQGFGGFNKTNEVNKYRNSFAAYAETQLHFNERWSVDGAARYEHYSDFGSTLNFKLASLVKLTDDLNFRISGSTGFRAPSMAQIYYNTRTGVMTNGVNQTVGLFGNNSEIAGLLGIPKLTEEKSKSLTAGFTYQIPSLNLDFTVDAFIIHVKNQIVLTGEFTAPTDSVLSPSEQEIRNIFDENNIGTAKFFANAIDVRTMGIDVTISHKYYASKRFSIRNDFGLNLNKVQRVGNIHASPLLESAGQIGNYFDETAKTYLERSTPRIKFNLLTQVDIGKFNIVLQNSFYGAVWGGDNKNFLDPTLPLEHTIHPGRIITDLSLGYEIQKNFILTIGSNNLFDIHPSKNYPQLAFDNQFPYDVRVSQFPFDGRYVFARVNFTFGK